jgi:hypothetical protein
MIVERKDILRDFVSQIRVFSVRNHICSEFCIPRYYFFKILSFAIRTVTRPSVFEQHDRYSES